MRTLAILTAAIFTATATAEDKKTDANLDGGYTIVSGEKDGKAIPAEEVKGTTVRFKGDTITTMDKDSKEIYVAKFKAEGGKEMMYKLMGTVPVKSETVGMIEKTGDEIKLIYALPGGEAPTEFKTKKGQQMFVLKNMNKEKKGDKK